MQARQFLQFLQHRSSLTRRPRGRLLSGTPLARLRHKSRWTDYLDGMLAFHPVPASIHPFSWGLCQSWKDCYNACLGRL